MPSPRTPEERLILEEIGEGPASRMLLLAISGARPARPPPTTSRALAAALRRSGEFRLVANGETDLDSVPDSLLAYRYLRPPTFDHDRSMRRILRAQLDGARARPRLARRRISRAVVAARPDARVAEARGVLAAGPRNRSCSTTSGSTPPGRTRCWSPRPALPGSIRQGQRDAADALQLAFDRVRTDPALTLEASGPGRILGADAGAHAARGPVDRQLRHARADHAAAGRLPQPDSCSCSGCCRS